MGMGLVWTRNGDGLGMRMVWGDSPAHLAGAEVECLCNGLQDLAVPQRELVLEGVKHRQLTS